MCKRLLFYTIAAYAYFWEPPQTHPCSMRILLGTTSTACLLQTHPTQTSETKSTSKACCKHASLELNNLFKQAGHAQLGNLYACATVKLLHHRTTHRVPNVLCSSVPCCAVPCCAVLCCAVLCCAVLCCAVLCCAVLCCVTACSAVTNCME